MILISIQFSLFQQVFSQSWMLKAAVESSHDSWVEINAKMVSAAGLY